VADAVLSHFRRLLEYVVMVAPAPTTEADDGVVADLDLEGNSGPNKSGRSSASKMVPHRQRSDEDKWDALAKEMSTFQYGLGFELKEFERRFAHALAQDNKEQAVRDLNDATTGLTDGVFAVMTTVYECFLGYAEPERMVPGHRDTLGKALAVRRVLAELRREIRELNAVIQDRTTPPDVAAANYARIVELVAWFMESDVFYYLRSDSRREFAQFHEMFVNGNVVRNRLDCEGFDKYLDSLAVVSQRGVLIKHDTDLKAKISGDLERALKFAAVVPDVAIEVIEQAFVNEDQRLDLEYIAPLGRQLLELVRPRRVMSSSDDGDVF
jgi:hypothetical protein